MLQDIYLYFQALLDHWYIIVTSSFLVGADFALRLLSKKWRNFSDKGGIWRRRLEVGFVLGAIVWAGFQAWQDEHQKFGVAEVQRQSSQQWLATWKTRAMDAQEEAARLNALKNPEKLSVSPIGEKRSPLLVSVPATKVDLENKVMLLEELHGLYNQAFKYLGSRHALPQPEQALKEDRAGFIQILREEMNDCTTASKPFTDFRNKTTLFEDVRNLALFNCGDLLNKDSEIILFINRFGPTEHIPEAVISPLINERNDVIGALGTKAANERINVEKAHKTLSP